MATRWYTSKGWQTQPLIHPMSRATRYGDGLFETMAIREGQILRHKLHLSRARSGWEQFGFPGDAASYLYEAQTALALVGAGQGTLRWFALRSGEGLGYTYDPAAPAIELLEWTPGPVGYLELEVTLNPVGRFFQTSGPVRAKTLRPMMTLPLPSLRGGADYLVIDQEEGRLVSGQSGCLWLYRDGQFITPHEAQGCLLSTTRKSLLNRGYGIEAPKDDPLTLEDLGHCQAIVITSALGVKVVGGVEGSPYVPTLDGLQAATALHALLFNREPSGDV